MRGLRGFAAGVLTLVALQVLGSGRGPEQGGKFIVWTASGLRALMSPSVPGIPRAKSAPPGKAPSSGPPTTGGISGELPRNPPTTVFV